MDVLRIIVGAAVIVLVTLGVWWVIVCRPVICTDCGESLQLTQGPCLDGYIWNQKKDECI